jgi:hypothetical protein
MAISELKPRFQSPLAALMEQFVQTNRRVGTDSARASGYSGVSIVI